MSKIYMMASNWSSTGNSKTREVKPNISMVDKTVRLTLTDCATLEFMKLMIHVDDARVLGEMFLNMADKAADKPQEPTQ